jgi:hypothetical protein
MFCCNYCFNMLIALIRGINKAINMIWIISVESEIFAGSKLSTQKLIFAM